MFSEIVNSGREYIVASYIKNFIKEYGEVVNVNIDTQKRIMEFSIRLHGEKDITIATVIGYDIYKDDENTYFKYTDFITTKLWLNEIIQNFSYLLFENNQFIIPNKMLQRVLPILLK